MRAFIVSIMMPVFVLLSACAPTAAPSSLATISPSAEASIIPTIPVSSPTTMPAALPTNTPAPTIVLPTSDSTALATVAGIYSYKIVGLSFTMFLRPDGTYASLPSTGRFSVTADQITFVDMLPESGSLCSSEPGIYKWALKDSGLTLVPVTDNCTSLEPIHLRRCRTRQMNRSSLSGEYRRTASFHPPNRYRGRCTIQYLCCGWRQSSDSEIRYEWQAPSHVG